MDWIPIFIAGLSGAIAGLLSQLVVGLDRIPTANRVTQWMSCSIQM